MKKKWVVFGLTAIMAFGAMTACGIPGVGGDSDGGVSAEAWNAGAESIDSQYLTLETKDYYYNETRTESGSTNWKYQFGGDRTYSYYYSETMKNGRVDYSKSEEYIVEVNGISYEYTISYYYDVETRTWEEPNIQGWRKCYDATELADFRETTIQPLGAMVSLLRLGKFLYTYDKENNVYYMDAGGMLEEEGIRQEVKFNGNELYSLRQTMPTEYVYEQEKFYSNMDTTFTFVRPTINLPDLAGLNKVVAEESAS